VVLIGVSRRKRRHAGLCCLMDLTGLTEEKS
jgi:hypothetical protein